MAHVEHHAADQPHWQLEDVRGGRCALRQTPLAIKVQQRCLFLCACNRNPKLSGVLGALHSRRRGDCAQYFGYLGIGQRLGSDQWQAGGGVADVVDL